MDLKADIVQGHNSCSQKVADLFIAFGLVDPHPELPPNPEVPTPDDVVPSQSG